MHVLNNVPGVSIPLKESVCATASMRLRATVRNRASELLIVSVSNRLVVRRIESVFVRASDRRRLTVRSKLSVFVIDSE